MAKKKRICDEIGFPLVGFAHSGVRFYKLALLTDFKQKEFFEIKVPIKKVILFLINNK